MDISSWFCLVKTFITSTLRNSAVLFFHMAKICWFFLHPYRRVMSSYRRSFVCLPSVNQVEVQTKISESRHLYLMIVHIFCSGMPPCNVDIKRRPFFAWQLNKKTHNSLISDKWSMSYGQFVIEKLSSQVMAISCISCTLS